MKNQIVNLLSQNIEVLTSEEISQLIEIPPKPEMGDFAFPCFRLAKSYRKAPPMIAQDLKESIGDQAFLSEIKVVGGYLNFYVDKAQYAQQIIDKYTNVTDYGCSDQGKDKTICIDYSSPNVAKNFHVGHLRTTIIGNSLYKIFSKLGYKVVRINHLGDWGTQFGKLIVAYKKWGSREAVEEKGIEELMDIYVKFHEEAEKDDSLNDEARAWFLKMEQGDEEALEIWQWFRDISLKEFMRVYNILGMEFDSFAGESFYRDKTANDYAKNLVHIPYGLVSLKSGKISSRKGNVIFAEDLLRESINKTTSIIEEKNPDIPDKEEVAKQVGIGAIIFNDLYNQRIKDVIFDWNKLLNFDGETGPYVQYTYARASSVLRKIGEVPDTIDYTLLTDEASIGLLKEIERYPQVIKDAAERYEPSVIARYSIDLAHAFNKFYHECQINVEDETTKYTRTNVVKIARYIIKDALSLLGIQCPEQM